MAFIETIPDEQASLPVTAIYEAHRSQLGYVPNYARLFAHRPAVYDAWQELIGAITDAMDGRRYELTTLAAARRLGSSYCTLAQAAEVLLGSHRFRVPRGRRSRRSAVGVAENKELVQRFYEEVWDRGNVEFTHEVFADDYVRNDLRPTQALPGPAGMAKLADDFRRAFPDVSWRVDILLGEGDLVAARWTAAGTHTGVWGAVEPTGKAATFSGVNIYRFRPDGKVAEIWNHRDDLGLIEQLGAPVYAGAAAPPSGTAED